MEPEAVLLRYLERRKTNMTYVNVSFKPLTMCTSFGIHLEVRTLVGGHGES